MGRELRRIGMVVYLLAGCINGAAATNGTFYAPPPGFTANPVNTIEAASDGSAFIPITVGSNNIQTTSRSANIYFSVSWPTTNAWPAALPGATSGNIPA